MGRGGCIFCGWRGCEGVRHRQGCRGILELREGLITFEERFIVVANLTNSEKQQAESIAQRIAQLQKSTHSNWRDDLVEAEAMILMQNRSDINAAVILLDEKAARKVAEEMGLKITGFPGILGRAGLDGILTKNDIRQHLKTCQQQGTYYSDKLIETLAETYGR